MTENVKVAKSLGKNDCEKREFTVLRKENKKTKAKEIKLKEVGLNRAYFSSYLSYSENW